MEKSFDLKVIETLEQIIGIINESELPYTIVKYMLNDLSTNVQNNLNMKISQEKKDIVNEAKSEEGISK